MSASYLDESSSCIDETEYAPISAAARLRADGNGNTHNHLMVRMSLLERENRELARNCQQLALNVKRLQRLVYLDPLTGLGNRRCFDIVLDSEIRRAVRTGGSLSLLFCDVDYFKEYNDAYGHHAGDNALVRIAGALARVCRRGGERAARLGGEEFALILPNVDAANAARVSERLRSEVTGLDIPHERSCAADVVTISVGATTFRSRTVCDPAVLIETADAAMYEAKRAGRNQCRARQTR
jgi:diguanylate cyclase (GGDEF)-like protein